MVAPAVSHVIGTTGLIVLIFVLPLFYGNVVDNIERDVIEKELKEIADYTSNTIENLYFLVNSTNSDNISLEKELVYLPSRVENYVYRIEFVGDENSSVIFVHSSLVDDDSVSAKSWVPPGLYLDFANRDIEVGDAIVVVGCNRNATGAFVWIKNS